MPSSAWTFFARLGADPLYVVLVGPGGAGKGTVADRLVGRDDRLWLSRSWTTRRRRAGEPETSYVFVDRATFEARARAGGFLEWAEFLGDLYGTPWPEAPPGHDVLLEIDLQGARRVRALHPDAVVILLLAPSEERQVERLRARGDPEERARLRVEKGHEEEELGRAMTSHVVVNDDLDRAAREVAGIVGAARAARAVSQDSAADRE